MSSFLKKASLAIFIALLCSLLSAQVSLADPGVFLGDSQVVTVTDYTPHIFTFDIATDNVLIGFIATQSDWHGIYFGTPTTTGGTGCCTGWQELEIDGTCDGEAGGTIGCWNGPDGSYHNIGYQPASGTHGFCSVYDGQDWSDAATICPDFAPDIPLSNYYDNGFGDGSGVFTDAYTQVKIRIRINSFGDSVPANTQDLTVTPIWFGTPAPPPCPPGMCEGPYQPIRENEYISDFTGELEGVIQTASLITAQANSESSWYPQVPVYASYDGLVTGVSQASAGWSVRIEAPEVEGATRTAIYSNLTTLNVKNGDAVQAGCILGTAGPIVVPEFAEGITGESAHQINYASVVAAPQEDPEYEDWRVWEFPTASTMCGSSSTANCKNNSPDFASGLIGWSAESSGSQIINVSAGLIVMPPATSIHQDIVLSSLDGLYVTLIVSDYGSTTVNDTIPATIKISLSDAEATVVTTGLTNWAQSYEVGALAPTEPTAGSDIYRLKIENISTQGQKIALSLACLHDAEQGVNTPPAKCYFPDWSLDDPDQWQIPIGSTATFEESPRDIAHGFLGDNYINLPDLSAFVLGAATLSGNSDSSETYILSVRAFSLADSLVNALDSSSNAYLYLAFTNTYTGLGVAFTEETDPSLTVYGNVDFSLFDTYRFQFEVPEDVTVYGDIVVALGGLEDHSEGIQVTSICLEPADATWPNYNIPGGTTVGQNCESPIPPPNTAGAVAAAFGVAGGLFGSDPGGAFQQFFTGFFQGLNLVGWGLWGADQLRYWFLCFLAGLINGIIAAIQGIGIKVFGLEQWFAASFQLFADWFLGVTQFLGNFIRDFLIGFINGLWAAFWGIGFVQDIVDQINLGAFIATALATLAGAILTTAGLGLQATANLIHLLAIFWQALSLNLNDTTSADLGMPDCGSVGSGNAFYPFCVGLDLSDYAISQFPSIAALLIVLAGAIAYFTISRLIIQFGNAFGDVS